LGSSIMTATMKRGLTAGTMPTKLATVSFVYLPFFTLFAVPVFPATE